MELETLLGLITYPLKNSIYNMPKLDYKLVTTLTAAVQNITLPVTDPYSLYELVSSGSIAISGASTITSSGTLVEGITYTFKYSATVTSGELSIMGTILPVSYTHLTLPTKRIV